MASSVVTNYAKERIAISIGSPLTNSFIQSIGIGSGSGNFTSTSTTLYNEVARVIQTGSPDFTVSRKITFQGDFNSAQMSGITLTNFGWFQSGATGIGSTWFAASFGSQLFDGNNELQVTTTFEVL